MKQIRNVISKMCKHFAPLQTRPNYATGIRTRVRHRRGKALQALLIDVIDSCVHFVFNLQKNETTFCGTPGKAFWPRARSTDIYFIRYHIKTKYYQCHY